MKSRLKFVILFFLLLFLNNCTITYCEYYDFEGETLNKNNEKSNYNVLIFANIRNSVQEYKKTGFLKERLIYREPFYYYFAIYGNFEKIEDLEGYFLQNKTKKIPLQILSEDLNKNKKTSDKLYYNKYKYLYSNSIKTVIPITWDETDTLEIFIKFIGIEENGKKKHYELKREYKKKSKIENVNLIWEAIMGI